MLEQRGTLAEWMTEESLLTGIEGAALFKTVNKPVHLECCVSCGMAEGSCPQVFVVDRPINCAPPPIKHKSLWRRARKSLLLPLFGLVMFGLVLEGIFIYRLYKRTEAFSLFVSSSRLQNQSIGHIMGQVGTLVSNEVPLHAEEKRPMAHLQGSGASGEDGVVQWEKSNDGFISNMDYNSSGLVIRTRGFYYLYSKVHFQETENCVIVNHRVIRNTTKYGEPIALMKSKSLNCRNELQNQKKKDSNSGVTQLHKEMDLWNSFLAGIFELEAGDHVFVTLDRGLYLADNFFGAFMMS